MMKRIIVIILSLMLTAFCAGGIIYSGSSDKSVVRNKRFEVSFYNADGTLLSSEKYKKGRSVVFPEYTSREGYYFEGWQVAGEDGFVEEYTVYSDVEFHAVCSQVYEYDGTQNFSYSSDLAVYSSVSFDFCVVSGRTFAVALFDPATHWHNHGYEYVVIDPEGINKSYVTLSPVSSDGWITCVIDYSGYVQDLSEREYNSHVDSYGEFDTFHVCYFSTINDYLEEPASILLKNIQFIV